ncbi:MAG: Pyruvate synthase subunit PorC [Candidatus Bathyarchaeota archaeon BA1]|nr:MAG: Pyruvate synthase subunit PorC [Candidatus Bathyarchaeota archaeon BA1]
MWTVLQQISQSRYWGDPSNTAMLGAVVRATGIVDLKSIEKVVREEFPLKIAEKNVGVVEKAYREARSG